MKKLVCELCGSNNFTKENGYWICDHCKTKYTSEETKKIMVEGFLDVTVDKSDELKNFKKLAIQYYNAENFEQAQIYFSKVLEIDTTDWKATFYNGVCSSKLSNLAEFRLKDSVNSAQLAIKIIQNLAISKEKKQEKIIEILSVVNSVAISYQEISFNHYNQYWEMESSVTELIIRLQICNEAYVYCFDVINEYELNATKIQILLSKNIISSCVEICRFRDYKMFVKGTELVRQYRLSLENRQKYINIYHDKVAFVKKNEPSYIAPSIEDKDMIKSEGCYIATSIYGTYDCPELWTLRRFRDNILYDSFFGRAFIKFYYFTSPKVIKIFGKSQVFNLCIKKLLNRFVNTLIRHGISSIPYDDYNRE